MELRKTLAFSEPLAANGVVMEEKKLQRRLRERKNELLCLIPSLRSLRASALQYSIHLTDSGALLQGYLTEGPQAHLALGGRSASNDDIYLQDLKRVRADYESQDERLYSAVHAPLSSAFSGDQIELRRYAQRVSHSAAARDLQTLALPFGPLPMFMPLATPVSLKVSVTGITRQHADVEVLNGGALLETRGGTRPKRKMRLLRVQEHLLPQSGAVLQQAMDVRKALSINALVLRRWTDGTIAALELQSFHEENLND